MSPLDFLLPVALVAIFLAVALGAADSAMMSLSRAGLERALEDAPARRRTRLLTYHDDAHRTLAVLALGRVLAETTYAVAITAYMFERIDGLWVPLLLAIGLTGLVSFIGASVSPRTLGRRYPEATMIRLGPLIGTARVVLGLPARVLIHISNALTPGGKITGGPFATESELRQLVDRASEGEALEDDERDMIQGVFDLGDTRIRELMVPRTDMVTIDADATATSAMRLFVRSGFSRIPVIGDGVDDLRGMLYFKDVMRAIHSPWNPGGQRPVTEIMREVTFFPEFLEADKVMEQMRALRVHVGIVVDEYGGVAGIITIEDILEEIVGDIADEHDRREDGAEQVADGEFRVPARMPIDEVGELFQLDIDDEDVDTIGGLLGKTLGRVPIVGSEGDAHGLHMIADRTSGRRKQVSHLLITRTPRSESSDPELAAPEPHEESTP
ncbi:MAG: hemolysin family protein [Dermabacter sp.]|nr:hemolysin family protein [Dermabacter sp.]